MPPLICPICRGELAPVGGALKCPSGHSFDVAKEGYVNLLAGGRVSASMGDTRDMLVARRAFLDRGHYQPLSDIVNAIVSDHLQPRAGAGPTFIGDIGCGEGYYLGRLQSHLRSRLPRVDVGCYGVDVSRDAVRMAARRYRDIRFMVSDVWRLLPFGDGSLHVLLDIFSPRNIAEFDRVLGAEGLVVVVIPEPGHLRELARLEGFLGIQEDKRDALVEQFSLRFPSLGERMVEYEMDLEGDDLRHLVGMTPSARHLTPEASSAVEGEEGARVTAAFRVISFCR